MDRPVLGRMPPLGTDDGRLYSSKVLLFGISIRCSQTTSRLIASDVLSRCLCTDAKLLPEPPCDSRQCDESNKENLFATGIDAS